MRSITRASGFNQSSPLKANDTNADGIILMTLPSAGTGVSEKPVVQPKRAQTRR